MSSSFLATLYGQISSNLLERDANYEIESRNFGLTEAVMLRGHDSFCDSLEDLLGTWVSIR